MHLQMKVQRQSCKIMDLTDGGQRQESVAPRQIMHKDHDKNLKQSSTYMAEKTDNENIKRVMLHTF